MRVKSTSSLADGGHLGKWPQQGSLFGRAPPLVSFPSLKVFKTPSQSQPSLPAPPLFLGQARGSWANIVLCGDRAQRAHPCPAVAVGCWFQGFPPTLAWLPVLRAPRASSKGPWELELLSTCPPVPVGAGTISTSPPVPAADGLREQLQQARLASTPVFTLFTQVSYLGRASFSLAL